MERSNLFRIALILGLVFWVEGCHTTKVRVQSTPPGAQVHWDYEPKGTTPVEFPVEWLGNHRLTLDHPDFEQYVETVDLQSPLYLRFPLDFFAELKPYPTENHYEFQVDLTQHANPTREASRHEPEGEEKP